MFTRLASLIAFAGLASCYDSAPATACCSNPTSTVRVVNAISTPIEVVIDGKTIIPSLFAGGVLLEGLNAGSHTFVARPTQGGASASSSSITTVAGAVNTFAVVQSNGTLATAALDDTNSVVPAGATKVRVLHLAPQAGTIQVYRTQPDFQQPIAWQFPFNYQPNPTSLSAPFYQSTVGTWEIRVWQTPADSTGWANAPIKIVMPLASGEKRTVLILDQPFGLTYQVL